MANSNPSPSTRFKEADERIAEKPFCVRLPADIDEIVRAKGSEWARKALRRVLEWERSEVEDQK